ncbi:hypothetical protein ADEAN_000111700 [Angomonas deanei]|uniref:Uncharacterized protein n=1 Tax=Angomonas deanei TaxID=59799 RepID=A0A7G2C340_9TRYP|nr:hypothetical protein ADEAN_000111700 [Angomonas deanei]
MSDIFLFVPSLFEYSEGSILFQNNTVDPISTTGGSIFHLQGAAHPKTGQQETLQWKKGRATVDIPFHYRAIGEVRLACVVWTPAEGGRGGLLDTRLRCAEMVGMVHTYLCEKVNAGVLRLKGDQALDTPRLGEVAQLWREMIPQLVTAAGGPTFVVEVVKNLSVRLYPQRKLLSVGTAVAASAPANRRPTRAVAVC